MNKKATFKIKSNIGIYIHIFFVLKNFKNMYIIKLINILTINVLILKNTLDVLKMFIYIIKKIEFNVSGIENDI